MDECTCGYKVGHLVGGQPALDVDPDCPVHGSRTANAPDAMQILTGEDGIPLWVPGCTTTTDPDVAEPRSEQRHPMHDLGWRSGQSPEPAPGPTVCDFCNGTGELKGAVQAWDIPGAPIPECPYCAPGPSDVEIPQPWRVCPPHGPWFHAKETPGAQCMTCGYWKEPDAPGPTVHHDETHGYHTADGEPVPTDGPPCDYCGDFECPVCRELQPVMTPTLGRAILAKLKNLRAENTRLQEALITIAERLDDAGCQCDSSDEYVYICNLCTANDALAKRNP